MNSNIFYIKQLDGLRCFAVLGVLVFHLISPRDPFFSRVPFGYGVDLFFLLSGFLITSILFKIKDSESNSLGNSLKSFYIRRSLKIFPIYYITLIFLTLIGFQNYNDVNPWVFTYTTNIWTSLGKPYLGSYNHLWSLAVEEQFYLFWPILILIVNYKRIKALIIITILSSILFKIGIFYYNNGWSPAINSFTLGCMDTLGLGALLAYYVKFERTTYQKIFLNKWIFAVVFVFYFFTMIFPLFPEQTWIHEIFSNTLFSIFAFFIVAPAVTDSYKGIVSKILENRLIVHLGKISYGLYLYHFFMPDLYNYLNSIGLFLNNTPNFVIAFYFVSCLVISEISWYLVENPFLKLKSRFMYSKEKSLSFQTNN